MAEAAVEFLLTELKNLVLEQATLLSGLHEHVKELESDLKQLSYFLRDAAENKDHSVATLLTQLRDVVYDAEDIIEEFVLNRWRSKHRSAIKHVFLYVDDWLFIHKAPKRLATCIERIRNLGTCLENLGIKRRYTQQHCSMPVGEKQRQPDPSPSSFVGMKEEKQKLEDLLLNNDEITVTAIVGRSGIGKTTLAKKICDDSLVHEHFECHAWVTVGQEFQTKTILQDILLQLAPVCDRQGIMLLAELDLAEKLYELLRKRKYLVVLDDLWSSDAWKCLRLGFPLDGKGKSRIFLTTRSSDVATTIASGGGVVYNMRGLTEKDSWELFLKAAGSPDHTIVASLEKIAHKIVRECAGLPLAIITLGGLLARDRNVGQWERAYIFASSLNTNQSSPSVPGILTLSYDALPTHLKSCFLYLSVFPEDMEIQTKELYLLWIAEGMISAKGNESGLTMMDIADQYLAELADRRMVQVQEEEGGRTRKFKSCSIHDLMRDLCIRKAKEENFLEVMHFGDTNCLAPSFPCTSTPAAGTRRLSVCLSNREDKPFPTVKSYKTPFLRSLLFHNSSHMKKWQTEFPDIKELKFLRILTFNGLTLAKVPDRISEFVNLKSLSFSNCHNLHELPSSIGSLYKLQTLDLLVSPRSRVTLPNVIWKMQRLKHLFLPFLFRVHDNKKLRLDGLSQLEILENFDTRLCNSEDLLCLTNLRELVARASDKTEHVEALAKCMALKYVRQSILDIKNFDCYSERRQTVIAKIFGSSNLCSFKLEGHIGPLPQIISPHISEIYLRGSQLEEDGMETLQRLPNLRFLSLHDDAFLGKCMVCSEWGFPRLRHLELSNLPKLETWIVERGAMPKLTTLVIERCESLKSLPIELNLLPDLQGANISVVGNNCEFQQFGRQKKRRC